MCNLYSLNKKRDAVARFFRVSHNRAGSFEPMSAIFPKYIAPVVRRAADGEREIVTMSWGFMLLQNGRAPRPVTNVRDDTILKSSFWKSSFDERRCLVPASRIRDVLNVRVAELQQPTSQLRAFANQTDRDPQDR
jgi:putative SOS response-associated peptidase YedK